MRRGSAAIVPLFIAIMLLFWFMWIMGGANDSLHKVNQLENLQRTQERLIIAALRKKQELRDTNASMTETELNSEVNKYIHNIMVLNKIDDE
jgi:hypothetical protein